MRNEALTADPAWRNAESGAPSRARASGLLVVLALHAAAFWGLWHHRLIPTPTEAATVFVNFIMPPPPKKKIEIKPPPPPTPVEKPRAKPIEAPQPPRTVAEALVAAAIDYVAAPPPTAPVAEAPDEPSAAVVKAQPVPPEPAGPVVLGGELSVACPERIPPRYPPQSRRMREEGSVMLRVELDERGEVTAARVQKSSGFARLDDAALAAVGTWRCTPARREGRPVRAVALQPFNFVLQGS